MYTAYIWMLLIFRIDYAQKCQKSRPVYAVWCDLKSRHVIALYMASIKQVKMKKLGASRIVIYNPYFKLET